MKWPLPFLLASNLLARDADIVACTLNQERQRNRVNELVISIILIKTSQKQAEFMKASGQLTTDGEGGISLLERISRAGYPYTYANSLVGKGYLDALTFAKAMITNYPMVVNQTDIAHIGVGFDSGFWAMDMGSSKDLVITRPPMC